MSSMWVMLILLGMVGVIPVGIALGWVIVNSMATNSQLQEEILRKEIERQDQRAAFASILIFGILAFLSIVILVLVSYVEQGA